MLRGFPLRRTGSNHLVPIYPNLVSGDEVSRLPDLISQQTTRGSHSETTPSGENTREFVLAGRPREVSVRPPREYELPVLSLVDSVFSYNDPA